MWWRLLWQLDTIRLQYQSYDLEFDSLHQSSLFNQKHAQIAKHVTDLNWFRDLFEWWNVEWQKRIQNEIFFNLHNLLYTIIH